MIARSACLCSVLQTGGGEGNLLFAASFGGFSGCPSTICYQVLDQEIEEFQVDIPTMSSDRLPCCLEVSG